MESSYFIIEHPTRGTLRDVEVEWTSTGKVIKFRWSVTGSRNDPDKAMRFPTLIDAVDMHDRLHKTGKRSDKLAQIRRPPQGRETDYPYYCRECGEWIRQEYGHEWRHLPECPIVGGGD